MAGIGDITALILATTAIITMVTSATTGITTTSAIATTATTMATVGARLITELVVPWCAARVATSALFVTEKDNLKSTTANRVRALASSISGRTEISAVPKQQ